MSWTEKQRRDVVLNHEGQILAMSGHHGAGSAAEYARCIVDGAMNALIRIEGAREASTFAFGVADRVASGVRTQTPLFPLPQADGEEADEATAPAPTSSTPVTSDPSPETYRWAVLMALLAGVLLGRDWL